MGIGPIEQSPRPFGLQLRLKCFPKRVIVRWIDRVIFPFHIVDGETHGEGLMVGYPSGGTGMPFPRVLLRFRSGHVFRFAEGQKIPQFGRIDEDGCTDLRQPPIGHILQHHSTNLVRVDLSVDRTMSCPYHTLTGGNRGCK